MSFATRKNVKYIKEGITVTVIRNSSLFFFTSVLSLELDIIKERFLT